MKISNFLKQPYFYEPAVTACLLAVSRLPLHLGFLVFPALLPLLGFLSRPLSLKQTLTGALVFSFLYTMISLHWISLVTWPGFIGLILVFSLYFLILFYLINITVRVHRFLLLPAFMAFWMSFEYLQNFGEFRFPWFNLGYSLADYLPFIQLAEIGGVYLLSFLVIIVNYFLFCGLKGSRTFLIAVLVILGCWAGFGAVRLSNMPIDKSADKIAIVQVSVPQDLKWDPAFLDSTLELYREYTFKAAERKPSLIIWPESALPVYLMRQYQYQHFLLNLCREVDTDIFTGFPHYEKAGENHPEPFKFYNSASLFKTDGSISRPYYKIILVPFGERMPFLKLFPFLWQVQLGQANFEYGKEPVYFETVNHKTFSPLICFEIAFPELTGQISEPGVDFLVNITNDAWFKRSAGTYQHAMMTRLRAVETRKQIFRAANTGYSLIVSPTGRIERKTSLYEKEVIDYQVETVPFDSFFTKYFRHFPVFFVIMAGLMIIIVACNMSKLK
ncbi:MAG: apolipoprotein N-acyltransferase [Candidatus Cloacimonetes bacterium]|nr:apolipoprotein N-acyltransferase [Candidatus Cloacimonadota bacterium]